MFRPIFIFSRVFVLFLILGTAPAAAQNPCPDPDAPLAGGYELRDVHEVGSILILAPDGRFGYSLTVGAHDEEAIGCWHRQGRTIVLDVVDMRSNSDMRVPPRMVLDVQKPGRLTRRDIGEYAGTYTRVQRF